MSDTPAFDFSKFVPGFDFLQNLGKGASPAAPAMGGWVAPTLSVEELDKRITELKAVQFWLDQNATALKATIQALEVQKMTLATLKGMNFSMGDLASAFKLKPEAATLAAKATEKPVAKAPEPTTAAAADADAPTAPGVVDPLKWWGSLTEQFQQIAGAALKDASTQAALEKSKNLATNFAAEALKSVGEIAKAARKTVVPPAGPKADASKLAPAKKTPAKKAPAKKAAAKKHAG
ncbi:PhaM family polyhydroxyalkanoate granule multifunctional regulatory protein [Rhodoferax sp.]|uniref:PhaM family polyhydroxyalkanoate granule multifunctional regulatory protein n=1 Tax=Rhodoferax sp. TaxID=50421 RepID=UPI0025F3995F|nr:PhaM family polyhydroxyalkanoate granule multifunctional regulatory protein [Rhodoferax sp.]